LGFKIISFFRMCARARVVCESVCMSKSVSKREKEREWTWACKRLGFGFGFGIKF